MRGERWVGPVEAAEILGVNRSTIQRWIDIGEIQGVKTVGGHRRIRESVLRAFALQHGIHLLDVGLTTSVLIVDDEEEMVDFLSAMCGDARPDLKIFVAKSGFEAGRIVTEQRPALIFLDLNMPGLDGIEVCRFVREDVKLGFARIIGVTGERNKEALDRFMAAGATEILGKPVDPERLLGILDRVFQERDETSPGGD